MKERNPRMLPWPLTWNGSFGAREVPLCPGISASCWHQTGSPHTWWYATSEGERQAHCTCGDTGEGPVSTSSFSAKSPHEGSIAYFLAHCILGSVTIPFDLFDVSSDHTGMLQSQDNFTEASCMLAFLCPQELASLDFRDL